MGKNLAQSDHGELSIGEADQFMQAEQVIAAGLQAFAEVGAALITIRDERLYRASYSSFDAYVAERWDMKRRYADRLIVASEVVEKVRPIGLTSQRLPVPTSEAVARPLAKLKDQPKKLAAAWKEAVQESDGVPTAAQVASAVERQLPAKPKVPAPDPPTQLHFDFATVTAMEDSIAEQIAKADPAELKALKRTVKRWADALNARTPKQTKAKRDNPDVTPDFKATR